MSLNPPRRRSATPSRGRPAMAVMAGLADDSGHADAEAAVTALYQANALGLVRLAHVMVGDQGAAEDIVQEAFCGLYRRWAHLADRDKALAYVRSSVLNACRSALRRRRPEVTGDLPAGASDGLTAQASGEAAVISEEERGMVMAALRRLPDRQREVIVLRFYLDLSEAQIAAAMGISRSTVRSAAHRAFGTLGRILREPT